MQIKASSQQFCVNRVDFAHVNLRFGSIEVCSGNTKQSDTIWAKQIKASSQQLYVNSAVGADSSNAVHLCCTSTSNQSETCSFCLATGDFMF